MPRLSPGPAIAHSFLDGRTRPNNTQRSSSRSGLPCIRVTRCIEMRLVSGQPDPAVHVGRRICPCASPGPGLDRNHGWRDVLQDQSQCHLLDKSVWEASFRLTRRSRRRQSVRRQGAICKLMAVGEAELTEAPCRQGRLLGALPVTRRDSSAALRGGPCKIDWRVERIGVSGNAAPWASLALDLSRRAHLAATMYLTTETGSIEWRS